MWVHNKPDNSKEDDYNGQQQQSQASGALMPKHIPFPEYPATSELLNELIMFLFTTCAAAMQFINIYRTNWWMPHAAITNTVNLQHIDRNLIWLILVMNIRRLLYCIWRKGVDIFVYPPLLSKYAFLKLIVDVTVALLPIYFIAMMYNNRNYLTIFLLVYPFIVYFMAFGFALEPFLRFNYDLKGAYFNGFPLHSCSTNPNGIRLEIDVLRNDFNCRFKQVIFTSLLNTYYSAFLPCYFAHSVYYNVLWSSLHVVLVFLSVFTMGTVFSFPSKYSDILHRAGLHLGYWCKLEINQRSETVAASGVSCVSNWLKTTLWAPSTLVKYTGDLYRSMGPMTVAIPGNTSHARFYKLFHDPSIIYGTLSMIQACIIISGICLLYYAIEWHFILSLSFITLTNQFTFFKLMRDYLITKRVYLAESYAING